MKERLRVLAMEVSERYRSMEINCDPQLLKTFDVFKTLMAFFDCYHENNHDDALEILGQTKLVPLNMSDLDVCVQNFKK